MPTTPKQTKPISEMPTAKVLNELTKGISNVTPGVSIPSVVDGDVSTLRALGNVITEYKPAKNAFIDALVNRIMTVRITSISYENPWAFVKQGIMELGETVEEIFIEMAKPYQYNPEDAETTLYKRYTPDVKSVFHSVNFKKFYPMTISDYDLRNAFLSFGAMDDFITKCIEQVYTGANFDEFQTMKYLIARCALQGEIKAESVPAITKENAQEVTQKMVEIAKNMQFPSTKYNFMNVTNFTDPSYLCTFLTTKAESIFDVNVLAMAFNMEKAELIGRQVSVDGFGDFDNERLALLFAEDPYTDFKPFTPEELKQLSSIVGLMVDKRWFMIFDNLIQMEDAKNGKGLYLNYFYHVWKMFSISPFHNAVLFTSDPVAVSKVAVTPPTVTTPAGVDLLVRADVTATGFADKSVKWEITGNTDGTELIINPNDNKVVTVRLGKNQSAQVTVTATSVLDPSKKATSTITIG